MITKTKWVKQTEPLDFLLFFSFFQKRKKKKKKIIPRGTHFINSLGLQLAVSIPQVSFLNLSSREKRDSKELLVLSALSRKRIETHESFPAKRKPMLTRCALWKMHLMRSSSKKRALRWKAKEKESYPPSPPVQSILKPFLPRRSSSWISQERTILLNVSLLTISSTFHSLFRVLCIFPSRYLFAIGLSPVFSFRWNLPPILGCILKQPDSTKARHMSHKEINF